MPQVKNLVVDGVDSTRDYMIISSHYSNPEVKLFRNVTNPLDFLVKDYDRQPVAAAGQLRLLIWTKSDQPPVFQQPLTTVNAAKGHYKITLTPQDTAALPLGFYSWSVVRSVSAVDTMLFTDRNYATDPTLQIVEGIPQALFVPIELNPTTFTPDTLNNILHHFSSAIPASGLLGGQHTAVLSMTNFTGVVLVQGSMEADAPTNEQWINVSTLTYNAQSGNVSVSFEGNFTWTRFAFAAIVPQGLTNISYRN